MLNSGVNLYFLCVYVKGRMLLLSACVHCATWFAVVGPRRCAARTAEYADYPIKISNAEHMYNQVPELGQPGQAHSGIMSELISSITIGGDIMRSGAIFPG